MGRFQAVMDERLAAVSDLDKAAGRTKFAVDLTLPNMLHAKIVRAPIPHATIIGIDASPALDFPGVIDAITAEDIPDERYGPFLEDQPVLARGKVRHIGEPVAVVAAEDQATASLAAQLVRVDYDALPAVFQPEGALEGSGPIIHEAIHKYTATEEPLNRYGNVCLDVKLSNGKVEAGFRAADLVLESDYQTQVLHTLHLEPHVALAEPGPNQTITIWTSAQEPFVAREMLSQVLDVPPESIRIIVPPLGGGFGGKEAILVEPLCALIAWRTGRPVKLELSLHEELTSTSPRPPIKIRLKTGVTQQGKILARQAEIICDAGAYGHHAIGEALFSALTAAGPYNIPSISARARCVYTNNPPFGCYRGYGVTHSTFASESQIDEIAESLDLDPLELRLLNCVHEGDLEVTGQEFRAVALEETLHAAADQAEWKDRDKRRDAGQGFGISCAYKGIGASSSNARVEMDENGLVTIWSGTVDMGTATGEGLKRIAAERLEVPRESIQVVLGDTAKTSFDLGNVASRVLHNAGNAVLRAVDDVRLQLLARAAESLEVQVSQLQIDEGSVTSIEDPSRSVSYSEIIRQWASPRNAKITGYGFYDSTEGRSLNPENLEGYPIGPMPTYAFATHVVQVQVDRETGHVRVLRVVAAHDVGRAINPVAVNGQIEGGIVMGIGATLSEELLLKDGGVENPNLVDYRVLTTLDVPVVDTLLIEEPDTSGPLGAKGVGELPALPIVPAIVNAIHDAVGVRLRTLPVTPERLLTAMENPKSDNLSERRNAR